MSLTVIIKRFFSVLSMFLSDPIHDALRTLSESSSFIRRRSSNSQKGLSEPDIYQSSRLYIYIYIFFFFNRLILSGYTQFHFLNFSKPCSINCVPGQHIILELQCKALQPKTQRETYPHNMHSAHLGNQSFLQRNS